MLAKRGAFSFSQVQYSISTYGGVLLYIWVQYRYSYDEACVVRRLVPIRSNVFSLVDNQVVSLP
jgi:hypothetical protein